jgi:predicted amidophosphoribosyltransferase
MRAACRFATNVWPLHRIPSLACGICARPLPGLIQKEGEQRLCSACRDKTYAFDRARSYAIYQGRLVQTILLLKFEHIDPWETGLQNA